MQAKERLQTIGLERFSSINKDKELIVGYTKLGLTAQTG